MSVHIQAKIEIRGTAYDVARIRTVSGEVVWCLREVGTRQPLYACVRSPVEPHEMTIVYAHEVPPRPEREGTTPDRFYHSRDGEAYRPWVVLTDASGVLAVKDQ